MLLLSDHLCVGYNKSMDSGVKLPAFESQLCLFHELGQGLQPFCASVLVYRVAVLTAPTW